MSILLVIVGHLEGTRHFSPAFREWLGDYANLGVRVFFVISGFLITRLLINEYNVDHTISLRRFYLRRALRICPPFFVFIAAVALATWLGFIHVSKADYVHALTYTMNYNPDRGWYLGHLWSLSVEEQFYLLWPFAFCAMGPSRAMRAAAVFLVLGPMSRLLMRVFVQGSGYGAAEVFPVIADSLAAGCLLAGVGDRLCAWRPYSRILRSRLLLFGVPLLLLLINAFHARTVVWILGESVLNLGIALIIHRLVLQPDDAAGRLMNAKPLVWLGGLSYSLYLWQQPFLDRATDAWPTSFPMNIVLAVTCACASYYLLEQPLNRLRNGLRPHERKIQPEPALR